MKRERNPETHTASRSPVTADTAHTKGTNIVSLSQHSAHSALRALTSLTHTLIQTFISRTHVAYHVASLMSRSRSSVRLSLRLALLYILCCVHAFPPIVLVRVHACSIRHVVVPFQTPALVRRPPAPCLPRRRHPHSSLYTSMHLTGYGRLPSSVDLTCLVGWSILDAS